MFVTPALFERDSVSFLWLFVPRSVVRHGKISAKSSLASQPKKVASESPCCGSLWSRVRDPSSVAQFQKR